MVSDEDRRQVERLQNLIQGFNWTLVKTDFGDDVVTVTLTRPTTGEPEEAGAGPG